LSPIIYKCAVDFPKKLAQDALTQLYFQEGKNRGQDREKNTPYSAARAQRAARPKASSPFFLNDS
jgi:hypothetical protein